MKFYKVRSLKTGEWLNGSKGFYGGNSTTYNTKTGAKAGYTHYKKRNSTWDIDPAEIVEFETKEVSTEKIL